MPIAEYITITLDNDLYVLFNDTMIISTIDSSDLLLQIYGPESSYSLTWEAEYLDDREIYIQTDIRTSIQGGGIEIISVEFINRDSFTSAISLRGVNPENEVSEFLNEAFVSSNAGTFGQTAMYIFLFSVFLAIVSSFGGNSMEMMWGLMNTLQILFFISLVYITYPNDLVEIFKYLGWANANNQYLAQL